MQSFQHLHMSAYLHGKKSSGSTGVFVVVAEDVIGSSLSFRAYLYDILRIGLQLFEPAVEIRRRVLYRSLTDAGKSAKERRGHFSDEFFFGILV